MHGYGSAFYELKDKLQPLYDEREAVAIAHEVLHHITGLDKSQRLIAKEILFNNDQQGRYETAAAELLTGKPLQYVLGSAWFMGREYVVNEHVLIPRPETEELVDWIVRESKVENIKSKVGSSGVGSSGLGGESNGGVSFKILDIGTGSGCISVSLKLGMREAEVTACDISEGALGVARRNAERLGAGIDFVQLDFLDIVQHNKLGIYDVIVSNPPYIPVAEREKLHKNVREYEPGIALFVPDNDALIFYRAIALFGREHLVNGGAVYCELDAEHAMECKLLFEEVGYKDVAVRKDMNGNWRMLRAGG